jgi:hypothetical protein
MMYRQTYAAMAKRKMTKDFGLTLSTEHGS